MNNFFEGFGLSLRSDIVLPNLRISSVDKNCDVCIRNDQRYEEKNRLLTGGLLKINGEKVIYKIPSVAIFSIEKGKCIYYSTDKCVNENKLQLYILGTCMGIVLMQRRILPLHGSAISIDGKSYAIVGDSGAGKSTLASAFLKRGYKLLSDDVIPVSFSNEGVPMVTPAYPQQKLWQESMDHFGLESREFEPIIDRETKFKVPVGDQFEERQLPLAGIIELTKTNDEQIHMEPIQDLYRFSTLFKHTYRNFIIRRAGLMDWHFNTSTKILPHVDMFHMRRPVSQFTANELVDKVLQAIGKEESVV
ncbi:aldolase [Halobacillus trueperi]|uniref:aldolase n=1 Tax=Halobacillus trueperi TaxID=156205 RepID=UPI003736FC34